MNKIIPLPIKKTHYAELLQQHSIAPTSQRLQIARILFARKHHVTADTLLNFFRETRRPVAKATIYNTLNLFTEKGLLRPVVVDGERVFYDSNTEPHYHFFNETTGELIDIEPEKVKILQIPAPPEGMDIRNIEVIIRIQGQ